MSKSLLTLTPKILLTMPRNTQLARILEDPEASDAEKATIVNHIVGLSNTVQIDVADARLVRVSYPILIQAGREQGLIVADGVPMIVETE